MQAFANTLCILNSNVMFAQCQWGFVFLGWWYISMFQASHHAMTHSRNGSPSSLSWLQKLWKYQSVRFFFAFCFFGLRICPQIAGNIVTSVIFFSYTYNLLWNSAHSFTFHHKPARTSKLLLPMQKYLPRMAELAWQLSRYLWRGLVNFKKKF